MKLSIVIGTLNRLQQLKNCITSIFSETLSDFKIYVTDAGSTDGTTEYLQSKASDKLIPVFVGKKTGQAKAYNDVFKLVDTPYVCWLSDDNVIINKGLDIALSILDHNSPVGLVALKTRDKQGPFVDAPYIGGLSSIGILNVNQGMLPTKVLKKVGGFSEEFTDYGIDPDLTAKILFAGYKIVYTKKVAIHHYRNWSDDKASQEHQQLRIKHAKYYYLYDLKYAQYLYNKKSSTSNGVLKKLIRILLKNKFVSKNFKNMCIMRDLYNVVNGKYISIFDLIINFGREYYLVQSPSKSSGTTKIV
jgi:GT2 family glycosyltransferase